MDGTEPSVRLGYLVLPSFMSLRSAGAAFTALGLHWAAKGKRCRTKQPRHERDIYVEATLYFLGWKAQHKNKEARKEIKETYSLIRFYFSNEIREEFGGRGSNSMLLSSKKKSRKIVVHF